MHTIFYKHDAVFVQTNEYQYKIPDLALTYIGAVKNKPIPQCLLFFCEQDFATAKIANDLCDFLQSLKLHCYNAVDWNAARQYISDIETTFTNT